MSRGSLSRFGIRIPPDYFSDSDFRCLSAYPNENTLTVNITHKQLRRLDPPFSKLVAIAPTRFEEGASNGTNTPLGKGYDIKLETAKEIVFQHKAPDNTVVRNGKQWLNYKIDTMQMLNLAFQYNPKEAFYALPATPQHQQIRDGLERTVFVDVWAIFLNSLNQLEEISRIYVEYHPDKNAIPEVKGKYKTLKRAMNGYPYCDLYSGDRIYGDALTWDPIERRLKGCDLGLPIRGIDPETYPFGQTDRHLPGYHNDYLDQVTPTYRAFLRRRYAIHQYATGDEHSEEVFDWLIHSLQTRLDTVVQAERTSVPVDFEFTSEDMKSSIRENLNRFTEARYPLIYRLDRTQRYVLEKGEESSSMTI